MSYKLGYIKSRVGVPSVSDQRASLINHGVSDNDIYETLSDCLDSLRRGDTLAVYTVAIFGRNNINDVFLRANDVMAECVESIRHPQTVYKFGHDNMQLLSQAWEELNDVSKKQIAAAGRLKGGRKPGKAWGKAKPICDAYHDGMPVKELADVNGVSPSTIRRILREEGILK